MLMMVMRGQVVMVGLGVGWWCVFTQARQAVGSGVLMEGGGRGRTVMGECVVRDQPGGAQVYLGGQEATNGGSG